MLNHQDGGDVFPEPRGNGAQGSSEKFSGQKRGWISEGGDLSIGSREEERSETNLRWSDQKRREKQLSWRTGGGTGVTLSGQEGTRGMTGRAGTAGASTPGQAAWTQPLTQGRHQGGVII